MATLAEQVQGERMARIALSMIAEPNDLTTGYILGRHGGVATLSLVESDHYVTGLGRADVLLWRERLRARIAPDLMERVAEAWLAVRVRHADPGGSRVARRAGRPG